MANFITYTLEKVRDIRRVKAGDSISQILLYWLPEMISAMILIVLPPIVDSYVVANSQTLTSYGALALATNFLYSLTKFAEAIPIASIAIVGRFNGAQEYEKCGEELGTTFWTTTFIGIFQFVVVLFFAEAIYHWLGVSGEIVTIGAPFLRLKSIGILLIFSLLSLIGFMRAIKNTHIPMLINITGMALFVFFDIALVLGKFGFPSLGLHGSAYASIIQFGAMNAIALGYILFNPEYKKYFRQIFFSVFNVKRAFNLLNLSWPIIIDKISFALSYPWLTKMLAPMGTSAITTFDVVKNLERFAFLPAIAFATVITFLVSNRLGAHDYEGAKNNIKKVLLLTGITVGFTLAVLCFKAHYFVSMFDPKNQFTDFGVAVLPMISLLVTFDFVQVIFSGALRGAGDVRSVMLIRFFSCIFFLFPASYVAAQIPTSNHNLKFVMVYGCYYLTTGIMSIFCLKRIMSNKWQKKEV
ncbi:MAG: MATE family efflux transporter [bacterium]